MNNLVIIWGVDDFNTLGLMRELGQNDLDLIFLIKGKRGMAARSRYCQKYVETRNAEDGFHFLMRFKTSEYTAKPIIVTNSDEISVLLDRFKTELETKFILPGTRQQGLLENYTDKYAMSCLASELGITTPWSKCVRMDSDISDVPYPCIIKPCHLTPGYYNEFKFRICQDAASLRKTLRLVRKESVFVVQQYIPKEHDLLLYGARMQDGHTVLAGCMVRDRMADSGSFSHGLITNDLPSQFGELEKEKMVSFLERINYCGLFSFEYGLTPDKAFFFEVNLRNDGCSHYFFQAGANIPLAWVMNCVGKEYTNVSTRVTRDGWFVDEVFDIENVLHGRISIRQWMHDKKVATIFKYYDKDDMNPFWYVKRGMLRQLVQDLILAKYRLYIVYGIDYIKNHL